MNNININPQKKQASPSISVGKPAPQPAPRASIRDMVAPANKPSNMKKALSVAGAVATSIPANVAGLMGHNPQSNNVPAYTYGNSNKTYGDTYNKLTTPGKIVSKIENSAVKKVKNVLNLSDNSKKR